jgi:hypothetical protein
MREIGIVKWVQIQQSSLKTGEGANRVYQPNPLLTVEQLRLTAEGIEGITAAGTTLIDVHHRQHPQTRQNRVGDNGISFGFLKNYDAIRERFGDHLPDGVGGENILIEADTVPDSVQDKVWLRATNGQLVGLCDVRVAVPCEPFTRFCANKPLAAPEMKAALQFLDDGRRGYYATLSLPTDYSLVQAGAVLLME